MENLEEKIRLTAKCTIEKMKEISGANFDKDFLEEGLKRLEEFGALDEYEKEVKEFKALIEKDKIVNPACSKLLEIIKNLTIWNTGKNNDELIKIKEVLNNNDKNYIARAYLYKELLELPKIKEMDEIDKIRVAMELGALDFSELGLKD